MKKKTPKSESIPEFFESLKSLPKDRRDYIDSSLIEQKNKATGCLLWIITIALIIFLSCTPAKKIDNRFVYVRIIKITEQDSGYWVFFRDRIGVYKTFQYEKPDTVQPGKVVGMSRIFRVN